MVWADSGSLVQPWYVEWGSGIPPHAAWLCLLVLFILGGPRCFAFCWISPELPAFMIWSVWQDPAYDGNAEHLKNQNCQNGIDQCIPNAKGKTKTKQINLEVCVKLFFKNKGKERYFQTYRSLKEFTTYRLFTKVLSQNMPLWYY